MGGRRAFHDGQWPLLRHPGQAADEVGAAAAIDAIGEPDQLGIADRLQEPLQGGQRVGALDDIGFGRQLAQRDPRGAAGLQRKFAGCGRQRQQCHRAARAIGFGDQLIGGVETQLPTWRSAPAIIDQQHQRRIAGTAGGLRIPHRAGGSQDHQRRGGKAQRGQPPGRARWGFFFGRDLEQQPGRRKIHPPRPRRHHPEQPPQHR